MKIRYKVFSGGKNWYQFCTHINPLHMQQKKQKNWRVSPVSSEFVNDFLLQSDPRSTIRPAFFFFRGDLVMKIFSTAILPLQKEHLAVDGARLKANF